jgi:hypothetical protein
MVASGGLQAAPRTRVPRHKPPLATGRLRVQLSRLLKREAQRVVELIRLTRRSAPVFETIADLLKVYGDAIRKFCRKFVVSSRRLKLFAVDLWRVLPAERPRKGAAGPIAARAARPWPSPACR